MIIQIFLLNRHSSKKKITGYILKENGNLHSALELQFKKKFEFEDITPETIKEPLGKVNQDEIYVQIHKYKNSILESSDNVIVNGEKYFEGDKVKSPKLFGEWVVKKGLYTPNKNSTENISGDGPKFFGWYISNEEYQNSIEGNHYNEYEIAKFPILKLEIYQMQEEIKNDFLSEKEIKDTDNIVNRISKTTEQTELITNYLNQN